MRPPVAPSALRVAVTGASGFLGCHVVECLTTEGCEVVPIHLPRALQDESAWQEVTRALAGAAAVVHLAARVHHGEDGAEARQLYVTANLELTRRLLRATIDAGAGTFLFTSSVKAVGEGSAHPWDETVTPAPSDAYGESKLAAERVVSEAGARAGIRTVVLRLPLVYGPGMRANMLALFRAVARGVPLPLGAVSNRRSLLYVGNAAKAIGWLLRRPESGSGLYFLRDGEDVSTAELARRIARALGRRARLVPLPPAMLRFIGQTADLLLLPLGRPALSPALGRLLGSLQVDDALIRARTGFVPPFTLDEGLAHTAQWFLAERTND